MMTPAPKASSYGADEDVKADRFDTATEKDMTLNAVVGKGVVDMPSSSSSPAIQKMKSICAPRGLGNGRLQTFVRMRVGIAEEEQSLHVAAVGG
jgi:hypothetical protein